MTLFRRFSYFVSSENRKTIMLSSVYVQVDVTSDNERLRRQLGYLRKKTVLSDGDISGMDEIIHRIAQIYEQCRLSRFEKTVLPVLARTGKISQQLLAEFRSCRNNISETYFLLTCFPWKWSIGRDILTDRVDLYIRQIEDLIDRKETRLFEQAKEVLSDENWFEMAETFMEEDNGFPEFEEYRFGYHDSFLPKENGEYVRNGFSVSYR